MPVQKIIFLADVPYARVLEVGRMGGWEVNCLLGVREIHVCCVYKIHVPIKILVVF